MIGESFRSINAGMDSFGAYDIAFDSNMDISDDSAIRLMLHSDTLENHRDHFDGDRVGANIVYRTEIDADSTLDLSYELVDHERFIDRGIPTLNGKPYEPLKDVVFGTSAVNYQTAEADIFRATMTTDYSETSKGIFSVTSSEFEKLYQNLYAQRYDAADNAANTVRVDGYKDPTERENLIVSANLVNELQIGNTTHTILFGAELIDTDNKNERYDSYFSTTGTDREVFSIPSSMSGTLDISTNSAGIATVLDFTSDLNRRTASEIEVTSVYFQDQIELSDKLLVLLGGRLDQFDITVDDVKAGTSQSREDDEFSPRAGVIFKPQENVSLYYSYSESFLPRSGEQYKKLTASAAALDPDVYESSEIGVNWDITPDLSLRASYFDSEQTIATRDESGEGSEIVGLQVDGIELEIKGQVSEQLYVSFGYSDMDGETSSGGEPREIPENTMSLWTTYQVNDKFGYGLGVTRQGESNISNNKPGLVLPDYTRVDFAAFYDVSDDLTIRLNVENITDEVYFPHSHSTHQASVGEEVNARLSITRRF